MSFREISPEALSENVFKLFGKDWLLLTAKDKDGANPMTVGWGGFGVMWGKNVVFVVVRPERYTYGLMEENSCFSLAATNDRSLLGYCGRTSGRDTDKIREQGLTLSFDGEAPYIEEARLVINCEKIYADSFKKECFLDGGAMDEKWYGGGYHKMYIAEIKSVLVKEDV